MTSVERIKEFCNLKPEEDPDTKFKDIGKDWPTKGSVELRNVLLKYDESLPYSLLSISLKVGPGEKVI